MYINNKIKKLFNSQININSFSANFIAVILNHLDNEENVIFKTPDNETKISVVGHLCIKTFDGFLLKGKEILKIKEKHKMTDDDFINFINQKEQLIEKGYFIESEPDIFVNDKKATY